MIVKGRVQGVCFRAFGEAAARELGLTGWVRNMPAGEVEIVAEGDKKSLTAYLSQVKTGPTMARVTEVIESWSQATGEFEDFKIIYRGSPYT